MIFKFVGSFLALLGLVTLVGPVMNLFLQAGVKGLLLAAKDPAVLESLEITFAAGILSTLAAVLTGVPLAYTVARARGGHLAALVEGAINLTVAVPHVAVGIMLLLVVAPGAPLGKLLSSLHLYLTDNLWAVVLCMWYVGFPYLVSAGVVGFRGVPEELELVARNLGASRFYTWRRIVLPMASPALWRGCSLAFARSLGEMGSLLILAYHPKVITILMLERFQEEGLRAAQGITALALLVNLVFFATVFLGLRRLNAKGWFL